MLRLLSFMDTLEYIRRDNNWNKGLVVHSLLGGFEDDIHGRPIENGFWKSESMSCHPEKWQRAMCVIHNALLKELGFNEV